jgi:Protein of unknown function (DUF3224)
MSRSATATFKIESWDEEPYAETEGGGRLTHATVKQALSGDIEGAGNVTWLMCYRPDGTADFVGLARVTGSIGGRTGSFVLAQTDGTFDGAEARGRLTVVPESATADLHGLTGSGEFVAPRGGEATLSLNYEHG